MIINSAKDFLHELKRLPKAPDLICEPKAVFMVEPNQFAVSEQTARDNVYMDTDVVPDNIRAAQQHAKLGEVINECGVPVLCFPGAEGTPDDIFPNNVFATAPGRLIVGSMLHSERQKETKREDIRRYFNESLNYSTHDLSLEEGCVAELTGAIIIDRARKIGYCGLTQRANPTGCAAMHEAFGLDLTYQFELKPDEYHTNVVMTVLADRALIICPDAFVDPAAAAVIASVYPDRTLVIDQKEKNAFAANSIAINQRDIVISKTAVSTLAPEKLEKLHGWGFSVHSVMFDEVELAGGSVRCTVGEIF